MTSATGKADLVVRNGTVVTENCIRSCDIGIADGKISHLGGLVHGERELDATGCVVLPGGIDVHVHLATTTEEGFVDDVATGTRAAAAGGITTVAHMAFPTRDGQTMKEALTRDLAACAAEAAVDYFIHPSFAAPDPYTQSDITNLAHAGHRSLKTVTLFLDQSGSETIDAINLAGRLGMLTMVHCEDGTLIDHATRRLQDSGDASIARYPDSRPDITELAAVQRVIAISEVTGAPVYLVHTSSARALNAARDARSRGLPVYVETRPIYLELTNDVHRAADGAKYAGMPPVRTDADLAALWAGLADGTIDTVASDHAPWRLGDKLDEDLTIPTVRKGIAELETTLPLLYADGVATGRITLNDVAAVTATNPARLFGLYPRKGAIREGSDADLLVLDPTDRRTIDGSGMVSNAGYSVYDGRTTSGWPRFVIGRGEILVDRRGVHARAGRGQYIDQGPLMGPLRRGVAGPMKSQTR